MNTAMWQLNRYSPYKTRQPKTGPPLSPSSSSPSPQHHNYCRCRNEHFRQFLEHVNCSRRRVPWMVTVTTRNISTPISTPGNSKPSWPLTPCPSQCFVRINWCEPGRRKHKLADCVVIVGMCALCSWLLRLRGCIQYAYVVRSWLDSLLFVVLTVQYTVSLMVSILITRPRVRSRVRVRVSSKGGVGEYVPINQNWSHLSWHLAQYHVQL